MLMKPKQKIVTFDSGSSMLKVSKRNSFQSKVPIPIAKHRNASFRLKQSETNTIHYKYDGLPSSDIIQCQKIVEFKTQSQITDQSVHSDTLNSLLSLQLPKLSQDDHSLLNEKKLARAIGIPHLKRRRTTPSSKAAPIVTISPSDYDGMTKQMSMPFIKEEVKSNNPIKSYCAPDPFANFNQEELDKLIANFKMPEAKDHKDNFRKIYREHVIQTLQSICLVKTIKCPSDKEIEHKLLNLPMPANSTNITRKQNSSI